MKTKLKRALIILFSAVCCFCMLFPIASYSSVRLSAHAEFTEGDAETMYEWVRQIRNYIENNLGYDLNTQDGKIETIKSDIQTVKEQTDVDVNDDTAATGIMKIPQAISDVTAHIWDTVLGTIASNDPATSTFIWNSETDPSKRDEKSYSFNPLDSAFTDITHVFQLAAYSIVLIFFAVSIIEQSVKYEIFSMKGMLRIFGRLLVSNEDNKAAFACVRGTNTNIQYRGDCDGSDKRYAFSMDGKGSSGKLYVFEAPIDLLSHATMANIITKQPDAWQAHSRISLAGTSDVALEHYLKSHSEVKEIHFVLDNDPKGRQWADTYTKKYAELGYKTVNHVLKHKDMNAELKALVNGESPVKKNGMKM